jgi:hypothetical protein
MGTKKSHDDELKIENVTARIDQIAAVESTLSRLREPSTIRGLLAAATVAATTAYPAESQAILAGAGILYSLIQILRREGGQS